MWCFLLNWDATQYDQPWQVKTANRVLLQPTTTHTHKCAYRACHFCWWRSNIRASNLAILSGHHHLHSYHHHFILDKYKTSWVCVFTDRTRIAVWCPESDFFIFFFPRLLKQVTSLLAYVRSLSTLCKRSRQDHWLGLAPTSLHYRSDFLITSWFLVDDGHRHFALMSHCWYLLCIDTSHSLLLLLLLSWWDT